MESVNYWTLLNVMDIVVDFMRYQNIIIEGS